MILPESRLTYLARKISVLTTRCNVCFLKWISFAIDSQYCCNMYQCHEVWCCKSPREIAVGRKQSTIHYPINFWDVWFQNKCLLPQVIPVPTKEGRMLTWKRCIELIINWMSITNLPKLRSLARGWGKTATGGDVMSLLWAPGKKHQKRKYSAQAMLVLNCDFWTSVDRLLPSPLSSNLRR